MESQLNITSVDDVRPAAFAVPFHPSPGDFDIDSLPTSAHDSLSKSDAKDEFAAIVEQLTELQIRLFAENKQRVLVVLQATDTGGKDSTIRSIFGPLNPQGVSVASFKAPSHLELAHDYLWRIHQKVPGSGQITVFNRSHYEDVLVVRVKNLAPEERWAKRYEHIRHFEQMLSDEGTTIVKIFLNISKNEQKQRLQDRLDEPHKHWKFNVGDLAERELWDDYRAAYQHALTETSTASAPWYAVPADQKWYRNLIIGRILVDTLESLDMEFPPPEEGLDDITIV